MFDQVKASLPNFPDEIIKDWIEPYALTIGWPPTHERWVGILFARDLGFWQNVLWEKQTLNLTTILLSPMTNNALMGLHDAIRGVENIYSTIENFKQRHDEAFRYLVRHGVFPKPICLLMERGFYSVVDGNHRITALRNHATMMNEYKCTPDEQLAPLREVLNRNWGIQNPAEFSPEQQVWVATLPGE